MNALHKTVIMQDLKPLYEDHTVEVPRRVWNQIESKLNEKKQERKFFRLRAISAVAACFVVATVLSLMKVGFTQNSQANPTLFATNEAYKSMLFEDLTRAEIPMYDYQQVFNLRDVILETDPSFGKRVK